MADLHIVGLGVSSVRQVTREAEQAISASNEVFYLDTGIATREFLSHRCGRVTSLYAEAYREGTPRLPDYRHMAATVIAAAMENPPVCFAVHGHPLVAVYAPFLVIDMAEVLGLTIDVQPGVSAYDSIVALLRIDPVAEGLQMYEATDLLLRGRPLQPDVPALIWQLGNLETTLHTTRRSRPARFARFVAHLERFYPGDHPVKAVYASPHPLLEPEIVEATVATLPEFADRIHAGHTLFIPAAGTRAVEDFELLSLLDSTGHLDSITVNRADDDGSQSPR